MVPTKGRLVLKVPKEQGETARSEVLSMRLLDTDWKILEVDEHLEIPLKAVDEALLNLGEVIERNRGVRARRLPTPYQLIRRKISLPTGLRTLLPRRWEKIGDVVLMKLPTELRPHREEVCRTYAEVLGAKAVLDASKGIEGPWRRPEVELLWGDDTETVHRENGVLYKLNPAKVMFSSGNIDERVRMSRACSSGEVIVDMFAGIGYFTLPIAVHARPAKVYACEVSPAAYGYLRQNLRLNEVDEVVEPLLGDCRDVAPDGVADRVLLGYLKDTHIFLPKALKTLRSGGWVYYHEACPDAVAAHLVGHLKAAADLEGVEVVDSTMRRVKTYAPGVSHWVLEALISGAEPHQSRWR